MNRDHDTAGPERTPSVPRDLPDDPQRLLRIATEVLDGVSDRFRGGVGAPGTVQKGGGDFATDVDIELEKLLTAELSERTGIPVHGEEFGGPDLASGTSWVLDPVDGTFNYSAGLPMSGVLLALVHEGVPVLGLTWMPLVGQNYAALADGPLLCNGEPQTRLPRSGLADAIVAVGTLNVDSRGRYPGRFRLAVLAQLSRTARRLRMHGSTGADLAFTASGALGGAIGFGGHPWDNAAGVALVRAAGGEVSDMAGRPWRIDSPSVVVAAPGVHAEILALLDEVGDPASYLPGDQHEKRGTSR